MYDLLSVKKIVIHWTANYGGTALNHYNYFNNLKDRYASAHFFVDKNEALCIIPLKEVAYHANDRTCQIPELKASAPYYRGGNANLTTIGIEMCVEKDGSLHPDMIKRTEDITAELCKRYNLDPITDVVRHFDVTKKSCPSPWISNPLEFIRFKENVSNKLKGVEDKLYQPNSKALLDSTEHVIKMLMEGEKGINKVWLDRFKDGKLTESEAIGLIYVAIQRGLLK